MRKLRAGSMVLLAFFAGNGLHGQAQEDPVLSLLVKKGLVTQQEANTATTEQREQEEKSHSTQIVLDTPSITKLQFYGDGRLRFENVDQNNHGGNVTLIDRERYRLRFGVDYTYSDQFKAGFELESANMGDAANQTLGGTFTKSSINIGRIYLQYSPTDWLTAVAGKFVNPWYTTTDLVYSFDLNPEGGAELFTFHPTDSLQVQFNAVQYIYINTNDGTLSPGIDNNDVFILGEQIPVTWRITKNLLVKVAPGFTLYTGGGNTNYDTGVPTNTSGPALAPTSTGQPAQSYFGTANSSVDPVFYSPREADDLAVLSAPGEFDFNLGKLPIRPYWDFELNTEGRQRIQNVYLNGAVTGGFGTGVTAAGRNQNQALNDNIAWAAGVQVGTNKRRGDWSALLEFRQIGLGAVDQNINGTDFADSYANQEGFKVAAAYNFTDFLTATLTYYDTWDYKSNLYNSLGGKRGSADQNATADSTLNLVSEKGSQRVQVDLGWKF